MPIYEYECPKCGRVFEEWAKSSDAHKDEVCPDCGAKSPRIMSRTSFILKGDGWYVSDYGYRKGITEEGGKGAEVPATKKTHTPAKQGEKSVVKKESTPPATQKTAEKPKAPKKEAKKAEKSQGASS